MRIKRYKARDIKTVLQMVKDELGSEAVILSTRELKDSLDLETAVEVTAGIGYQPVSISSRQGIQAYSQSEAGRPGFEDLDLKPALHNLESGLSEIKELLLDLTHRAGLSGRLRDRKDLVRLYRDLIETELDPAIARFLVEKAAAEGNGDNAKLKTGARARLSSLVRVNAPLDTGTRANPQRLALIGPSGVGKTTTLAKLAALTSVKGQKKVAIISLDTYRLGAAEQLKTYARIMGLPLRVAQDKEEFRRAMELFEDMDVVLIDTASRSLSHQDALSELAECLGQVEGLTTLLVLSATTKDRDMATGIRQVRDLPIEGLVISKIDETTRYGNVINNLIKFKEPVSFLTNGQKVPDDIITATPEGLAAMITNGRPGV